MKTSVVHSVQTAIFLVYLDAASSTSSRLTALHTFLCHVNFCLGFIDYVEISFLLLPWMLLFSILIIFFVWNNLCCLALKICIFMYTYLMYFHSLQTSSFDHWLQLLSYDGAYEDSDAAAADVNVSVYDNLWIESLSFLGMIDCSCSCFSHSYFLLNCLIVERIEFLFNSFIERLSIKVLLLYCFWFAFTLGWKTVSVDWNS